MRLRVLGNAGEYMAPLSDGSCYLVETDEATLVLDAGGGAARALGDLGVERIDALVLSHFHHDHATDLPRLRALLDRDAVVLLPPGEGKRLEALAQAYVFEGAWDFRCPVREAAGRIRVKDVALSFAPTQHSAPAFATRLEAEAGALVYASDSAPCAPLHDLAREADVLLMHTLLPTVEEGSEHARIHSTARTAAALAVEARARRLLLSHRYHESPDAAMREASSAHPLAELAVTGKSYDVATPAK